MQQITDNKIIDLLSKGYKQEILAFEFDIPIERIKKCRSDLEIKISKIIKIKERYQKIFLQDNNENKNIANVKEKIFEVDKSEKENLILNLEEKLKNVKNLINSKVVAMIINEIKSNNFTIEQCKHFYTILLKNDIRILSTEQINRYKFYISKIENEIILKLIEKINVELGESQDIDYLKELSLKLSDDIFKGKEILVNGIKYKIDRKIVSIQQNKNINTLRDFELDKITNIVIQICNGETNIENLKELIEIEAKRRYESKPKSKFSLTQEQYKSQIIMQINKLLIDEAEKYQIKDINYAIEILNQLSKKNETVIRTVVKNLIGGKKYQNASEICEEYSKNTGIGQPEYIRSLERDINNSKLSDIILKLINEKCTLEEQFRIFDYLEDQINSGKIKMTSINIGKTKGGKNIFLEDIWTDKKEKYR